MRFHERLRELKGGMSESALAEASGLPYPSVHSYCLGRRMPTFPAVVKLARGLGVSLEAFADCVDDEEPAAGKSKPTGKPAAGKKTRKLKGERE
jgi:transcriptional regulator with XRE-family HTH domain